MTAPNGPNDTATFQTSNRTDIAIGFIEVNRIVISAGASNFNFTIMPPGQGGNLTISGTGISNGSSAIQSFIVLGHLAFINAANVGTLVNITNGDGINGSITFSNSASAGSATFVNANNSSMTFSNTATAESANITLRGGTQFGYQNGAQASFQDNSSAANAVITINGGEGGDSGPGAVLYFRDTSSAAASTLMTNSGVNGSIAGRIEFSNNSTAMTSTLIASGWGASIVLEDNSIADMARIQVNYNGNLDIRAHAAPGVTVTSIEGDGYIMAWE